MAQVVERYFREVEAASSSLVIPTNYENPENLENQGFPDFLRHSLFIIIAKSVTLFGDNTKA